MNWRRLNVRRRRAPEWKRFRFIYSFEDETAILPIKFRNKSAAMFNAFVIRRRSFGSVPSS